MSWNKGNSKIMNKIDVIHHLILERKKQIFLQFRNLNLTPEVDINLLQIPEYNMEIDNLLKTTERARTAIFIKKQLKYIRRPDLETKEEPVIWITVYPKGAAAFNLQNHYRQWQRVGKQGALRDHNSTNSVPHQKARYLPVLMKWKTALNERETNITLRHKCGSVM